jgi:sugar phosphate isomerase/epimerase
MAKVSKRLSLSSKKNKARKTSKGIVSTAIIDDVNMLLKVAAGIMSIWNLTVKLKRQLPIGEGFIDHQIAVKALKEIDYDRTITLEVFTNSNDAKLSADKLRTMWSA